MKGPSLLFLIMLLDLINTQFVYNLIYLCNFLVISDFDKRVQN